MADTEEKVEGTPSADKDTEGQGSTTPEQKDGSQTSSPSTKPAESADSKKEDSSSSTTPTVKPAESADSKKEDSSSSTTPTVKPAESVKSTSGTMEVLRTKHRHVDGKKDENYDVRSQPDGAYNTNKPLTDRTARTADEVAKAYLDKHFKDWKNESNLTLDTSLKAYTYEKDKGANITTQRVLGDILERALRDKYRKLGFKNDERAKSVIALLLSLNEVKGIKEITPSMKNRVVQVILGVHTNLIPKG